MMTEGICGQCQFATTAGCRESRPIGNHAFQLASTEAAPIESTSSSPAVAGSTSLKPHKPQLPEAALKAAEDTQTEEVAKAAPEIAQTTPEAAKTTPEIVKTTQEISKTTQEVAKTTPEVAETTAQAESTTGTPVESLPEEMKPVMAGSLSFDELVQEALTAQVQDRT